MNSTRQPVRINPTATYNIKILYLRIQGCSMCSIQDLLLLDCTHSPKHALEVRILRILSNSCCEINYTYHRNIPKNNYGIPSSFPQLICVFGYTDGPTPVEIGGGPAEVVVCEGGISGKREGYLRAPTPAARVNLEILEPIFAD